LNSIEKELREERVVRVWEIILRVDCVPFESVEDTTESAAQMRAWRDGQRYLAGTKGAKRIRVM
jgi:hypothetical protein